MGLAARGFSWKLHFLQFLWRRILSDCQPHDCPQAVRGSRQELQPTWHEEGEEWVRKSYFSCKLAISKGLVNPCLLEKVIGICWSACHQLWVHNSEFHLQGEVLPHVASYRAGQWHLVVDFEISKFRTGWVIHVGISPHDLLGSGLYLRNHTALQLSVLGVSCDICLHRAHQRLFANFWN